MAKLSYEDKHKIINDIEYKLCIKCNRWLSMKENFYINRNSKDGVLFYCIECTDKKNNEYKRNNLEKAKKSANASYAKHKHKYIEYYTRIREENPDLFKDRLREWHKNNPERVKEYAKARGLKNHKITSQEWDMCKAYFNYTCAYCGVSEEDAYIKYGNRLHKEHVVYDGENDLSNCVPSCKSCNGSKAKRTLGEWYNTDNKSFSKERLEIINNWLNEDYLLCLKENIVK